MSEVRFCDSDRERWGVEEWISVSADEISVADLTELAQRFGFTPYEWPTPLFGEVPFEKAGSPDAERVPPVWQLQCWLWMALRQNGAKVSWDEAGEAKGQKISSRPSESPGKAEEATESSTTEPSESSST